MRREAPDVVLVTPYVDFATPQSRWIRSARALGVRSCIGVYSWDALTVRGQIRETPELVTVWNETQVGDAVAFHHVPPERVVATGAQAYDHWFDWAPADGPRGVLRARRAARRPPVPPLPRLVGRLRQARGGVGDRVDGAPARGAAGAARRRRARAAAPEDEGGLARGRARRRRARARLAAPGRADDGLPAQLSDYNVASATAKSEFYDSIHHAAAVVGVNTSALIESAIVGRPVHTFLDAALALRAGADAALPPARRGGRRLPGGDGRLRRACRAGGAERAAPGGVNGRGGTFLRAFIRPDGLDTPAGPRYVAALEALAARAAPPPRGRTAGEHALGLALAPFVTLLGRLPESQDAWAWAAKRRRRTLRRVGGTARKRIRQYDKRARRRARLVRRRVGAVRRVPGAARRRVSR